MFICEKPFLFILFVALGLSSCQKERQPLEELPDLTQIGANTMGCLVDGQAFTPQRESFCFSGCGPIAVFYYKGQLELSFARRTDDKPQLNRRIRFQLQTLRSPGQYTLDQVASPTVVHHSSYAQFSTDHPEPEQDYRTGPTASGQLTITRFDSVAHILAGTFAFTAREVKTGTTVEVTHGRFDVRYR